MNDFEIALRIWASQRLRSADLTTGDGYYGRNPEKRIAPPRAIKDVEIVCDYDSGYSE